MIAEFKPYPAMKPSGVEWLGEVPEHWDVRRLWASVHGCINGIWGNDPNGREDLPCVRVADFDRVRLRVRLAKPTLRAIAPGERSRRLLKKSDLLLEKSGGGKLQPVGVVMLYDHDAEAVCSNFVARMPVSAHCDSSYLTYLHSHLYTIRLNVRSIKQTTGIQNLDSSSYLGEPVAFPPLPEQAAIVRFLDYADRRIRRYIRAKQKLITLLEEQKQALIHQTVTGKVDIRTGQPYPAYKPSGVEWLGDVPVHWEVVQLRRVALDRCDGPFGSGLKSSHYTEEGIRVVRLQNIGHGEFRNSDTAFISPEYYSSLGDHSVVAGDILIAGLGDDNHPAGRACVAPESIIPAMVKADCFRFRLNQTRVEPRFAALQLTATATAASALLSTGATRQRTNLQSTSARAIGIPAFSEQVLIVEHVTVKASSISAAEEAAQREIALLREYRTRLIAEVVTGKLDVREAASRLPDEVEEPDLLDETDALTEGEEEPSDDLDTTSEEAAV